MDGTRTCLLEAMAPADAGPPALPAPPPPATSASAVPPMTPEEAVTLQVASACRAMVRARREGRAAPGTDEIRAEALRVLGAQGRTELDWAQAYGAALEQRPAVTDDVMRRAAECVRATEAAAAPDATPR